MELLVLGVNQKHKAATACPRAKQYAVGRTVGLSDDNVRHFEALLSGTAQPVISHVIHIGIAHFDHPGVPRTRARVEVKPGLQKT